MRKYSRSALVKIPAPARWRHLMGTFSVLLALWMGNSPVAGEFPSQRSVTRSFDVAVWYVQCGMLQPLQWHHNGHDGVSNHRRLACLLNCSFRGTPKKISKLRVNGLCDGNSPLTAQKACNTGNASIWWSHHDGIRMYTVPPVFDFYLTRPFFSLWWPCDATCPKWTISV